MPIPEMPKAQSSLWWYEPFIFQIMEQLGELERMTPWLKAEDTDAKDKDQKSVFPQRIKAIVGMCFLKIRNGCIDLNNFRGELALKDQLEFSFHTSAKSLFQFCEKSIEIFNNCKWDGFDKEIFSRDVESSQTPQAIDFRRRRGGCWKWREESV